jgi:hypothetical protein
MLLGVWYRNAFLFVLKMDTEHSSEGLVPIYLITQHHIPVGGSLQSLICLRIVVYFHTRFTHLQGLS